MRTDADARHCSFIRMTPVPDPKSRKLLTTARNTAGAAFIFSTPKFAGAARKDMAAPTGTISAPQRPVTSRAMPSAAEHHYDGE